MDIFDDYSILAQNIEHNIQLNDGSIVSGISLLVESVEIILTEHQLKEALKQISETKE